MHKYFTCTCIRSPKRYKSTLLVRELWSLELELEDVLVLELLEVLVEVDVVVDVDDRGNGQSTP